MGQPGPFDDPSARKRKKMARTLADRSRPQHQVRITQPFYLQTTEVTQEQWYAVMGTRPWREISQHKRKFLRKINVDPQDTLPKQGPDYPAVKITWDEAMQFCHRLSQMEGIIYRLPTEAEWEYSCRAGTTTKYSFGDDETRLEEFAWLYQNAKEPKEVGYVQIAQKSPNPWGFYDMHGNVREYCLDWSDDHYYSRSPIYDPVGPLIGDFHVTRGGAWSDKAEYAGSSLRIGFGINHQDEATGFRVVRTAPRSLWQGETLEHSGLNFSLDLPVGFTARPDVAGAVAELDVIHGYQYEGLKNGSPLPMLLIDRSEGYESLAEKAERDPDFKGDRFTITWQGIEIEVVRMLSNRWMSDEITYVAELPLSPSSVQVILSGPRNQQDDLHPLFLKVIDGFHGKINWHRTFTPGWLAYSEYYWLIITYCGFACVVTAGILLHLILRRHIHVAELVAAAIVYASIWQFFQGQIREMPLLSIVLFVVGICGTACGVGYVILKSRLKRVATRHGGSSQTDSQSQIFINDGGTIT